MSIESILSDLQMNSDVLSYPIHESSFVSPMNITFSQEVRDACEANLCGMYGKCWSCPPGVGRWQDLMEHYRGYENAFVYTTVHELEDSYDVEGMNEGRIQHVKAEREIEKMLSEQGDVFEICGAEGCRLCEKCTYPMSPCRHPELMHHSVEATGVNVIKLAADCGIHYINGVNTVTYFSVIYWHKK